MLRQRFSSPPTTHCPSIHAYRLIGTAQVPRNALPFSVALAAVVCRFLIKQSLLDPTKLKRAMSFVWDALEGKMPVVPGITDPHYQHSPSPGICRHDPQTWVGASVNHNGRSLGGLRSLGHLDWMLELVPNDPHVRRIAQQMLGPLRKSRRVRGVYPLFPSSSQSGQRTEDAGGAHPLRPHTDGCVCQLNAMCYLSEVPPRCGGTTVRLQHSRTRGYSSTRSGPGTQVIPCTQ